MSPERNTGNGDQDPRKAQIQAMLGSIESGVENEDYEFITDITYSQDLISPVDVVEYLHVKDGSCEDPVEQRRFRDATAALISSIFDRHQSESAEDTGQNLSSEEIERINAVVEQLTFRDITQNDAIAEEPETTSEPETDQVVDPYAWNLDAFSIDLSVYSDTDIEKAKKSQGYKLAFEEAVRNTGHGASYHIDKATKMIEGYGGRYKGIQRLLLDAEVYKAAEKEAARNTGHGSSYHFDKATEMIKSFASDINEPTPKIASNMLRSLDKHVYKAAETEANRNTGHGRSYHIDKAIKMIKNFASSKDRAQAMLDELGL